MNHAVKQLAMVLAAVVFAGCAASDMGGTSKLPDYISLYDRLGGEKAIAAVVDDCVNRALADPAVNFARKGVPGKEWDPTPANVTHVKKMLTEYIVSATGGRKRYSGPAMKSVHAGMMISDAEFDAFTADLLASMKKYKVPPKEQAELLTIINQTRPQMVEQ